jgi:copper chaperone CopZ
VILASVFLKEELMSLRGVQEVSVEADSGAVTITYDPSQTDIRAIREVMADVDYPASDPSR